MPTTTINREEFHTQIDGKEGLPWLVISNSLGTNMEMWRPQMADFSRHFRVLRYDARGHGQSVAPDRPYSIAELGRDAIALMDAHGIEKAHWLGLSKGGMTGMWVASHHPERFNRIVLANTAAVMGPPDLWNGRIRTVREKGMAAIVQATLERWFTKRFLETASPMIPLVSHMIEATPALGYAGCCAAIRDMDQREAIRGIVLPTLVIAGLHDHATSWTAGKDIHERIKGSQLVSLDAAHLSNIERPEEFTHAVVEFLRG
ncbi:MAG: 3-oxoadipate enol-lactonase [Bosea sp. (in: a-proteobacteria)]